MTTPLNIARWRKNAFNGHARPQRTTPAQPISKSQRYGLQRRRCAKMGSYQYASITLTLTQLNSPGGRS
jgi:hypothetical protein